MIVALGADGDKVRFARITLDPIDILGLIDGNAVIFDPTKDAEHDPELSSVAASLYPVMIDFGMPDETLHQLEAIAIAMRSTISVHDESSSSEPAQRAERTS